MKLTRTTRVYSISRLGRNRALVVTDKGYYIKDSQGLVEVTEAQANKLLAKSILFTGGYYA